jgi:hypothetical protein
MLSKKGSAPRDRTPRQQGRVEWTSPAEIKGRTLARGNSGFMMMSRYEVQVLDSFDHPSHADGHAAAIYRDLRS